MGKRIVRLTESELINLVKRVVKEQYESEPEMEEGFLGDIGRGIRKFATGHESSESREESKKRLEDELDEITSMVEENPDSWFFGNKWDRAIEKFEEKMEDNNYRGYFTINNLELDDPKLQDIIEKTLKNKNLELVVRYEKVNTGAQNLGSGAGSAARSYQSRAQANESRRRRNRLR
jgi:hypothetical protein